MVTTAKPTKQISSIMHKMEKLADEMDVLKKEAAKKVKKLSERYNDWETKLNAIMIKEKMDIYGAEDGLTAERVMSIHAAIEDYQKLKRYIIKKDAWDLLSKRVSSTAFRERLNKGEKVDGLKQFKKFEIKLKRKASKTK